MKEPQRSRGARTATGARPRSRDDRGTLTTRRVAATAADQPRPSQVARRRVATMASSPSRSPTGLTVRIPSAARRSPRCTGGSPCWRARLRRKADRPRADSSMRSSSGAESPGAPLDRDSPRADPRSPAERPCPTAGGRRRRRGPAGRGVAPWPSPRPRVADSPAWRRTRWPQSGE